jgi:hypothetical protein
MFLISIHLYLILLHEIILQVVTLILLRILQNLLVLNEDFLFLFSFLIIAEFKLINYLFIITFTHNYLNKFLLIIKFLL